MLFLFYLVNILIAFYLFKKNFNRKYQIVYQIQDLQEKLNILNEQNSHELKNSLALKAKIIRYNSLKKVVEEINENLDLDSVANSLASIAFSVIANNKGMGVLYLVDNQTQKLSLFKTKKEDKKLVIKVKEGNIFDFWVLRHSSPLLIEDIKKDFRFDLEKLKAQDERQVSSLISAPLISDRSLLGILKLDHPQPGFYTQDDLRFLVTICDLGAVALENSQLFQKTQDLAIHDGLTSLYTKGYFLERLKEECKRDTHQRTVFSLLMLDIDFFKNYNDKFGHTAGDIVLKNLSHNITESLKDLNTIISRFGGEEFCIILHGIDKKRAYTVADTLRQRIANEKIILRRQETNITVSIGIAAFPLDAVAEDELILKSDRAMYEAKQKGRNQVCCL
jgi:diguanylate cyclase (GGDEF)-like protein